MGWGRGGWVVKMINEINSVNMTVHIGCHKNKKYVTSFLAPASDKPVMSLTADTVIAKTWRYHMMVFK